MEQGVTKDQRETPDLRFFFSYVFRFDFGKMSNCSLRAAVFIAGSSVSVDASGL